MPFLGQDWRTPGEQWVKTKEGWERLRMWRLKLLENLNANILARLLRMARCGEQSSTETLFDGYLYNSQPHVFIQRNPTRESTMQHSFSESFRHLDITGAIKDPRRFTYVCKIIEVLVKHKYSNLSGSAQKTVFNILEEIIEQMLETETHQRTVRMLVSEVRTALVNSRYLHVGCNRLWLDHMETVENLEYVLQSFQVTEREDDGGLLLTDLPDECLLKILHHLSDHQDIVNTGRTENRNFDLSEEDTVWRKLCLFHFNNQQLNSGPMTGDKMGWKTLYRRLSRRYGTREVFGEIMHLCNNCSVIYWQNHGHPCISQDTEPRSLPLTPVMFMELVNP